MNNLFENYQEQFDAQEKRVEEIKQEIADKNPPREIRKTYVGSAPVRVLAINPNRDQLFELIGDVAEKFDTSYKLQTDNDGSKYRPVSVWFSDEDKKVSPVLRTLRLYNKEVVAQSSGNNQFLTLMEGVSESGEWAILSSNYSADFEVGKVYDKVSRTSQNSYKLHVISKARRGEVNYYDLLKVITKFPNDKEFIQAMKENNLDFDSVYEGNFEGLHQLVDWANQIKEVEGEKVEDNKTFIGIFTVTITDDGTARQGFSMNPKTWFPNNFGVLTKKMRTYIENENQKRINYDGKEIISGEYILDPLTEYTPEVVAAAKAEDGDSNDFDFDLDI